MDLSEHLAQCHAALKRSVAALGGDAESPRLAEIADLIIRSMTGPWRSFHTPQHIFDVGRDGSPVEVIAALFHDIVYVQVDAGIHLNLSRHLAAHVREVGHTLVLDTAPAPDDTGLGLTLALFGFAPGQALSPLAGQNEFLSALVAVKALEGLLGWRDLAQVVVCIEATIPFRGALPDGRPCEAAMHERLTAANARFALGLTPDDCTQAVERAVRLANRDIGNFGSAHPAEFLNNTWNLIPETNHDLQQTNTFSIQGYRSSLQKMEGFLGQLRPEVVFRRYGQEPDAAEHALRLQRSARNLAIAVQYLRVKLISIGLLEALSRRMGCDVSLSAVMGPLLERDARALQLEHHLPRVPAPYRTQDANEACVMELLETGRSADSAYDTRHSPVASYLVKSLGMPAVLQMLPTTRSFFADAQQAEALLQAWPPATLAAVREAMVTLLQRRIQALQGLALEA